ncbi:hypothetical protein [Helicobacter sp. 'CLO3_human']|uniref:hypothetical protein n=1 Tax=Helicobacter sp. 'CLO3_human' TaxID=2020249 RepID=UPI001F2D4154|nr:hypothetical protein [Helicobacter sp. 'CLO3_human']
MWVVCAGVATAANTANATNKERTKSVESNALDSKNLDAKNADSGKSDSRALDAENLDSSSLDSRAQNPKKTKSKAKKSSAKSADSSALDSATAPKSTQDLALTQSASPANLASGDLASSSVAEGILPDSDLTCDALCQAITQSTFISRQKSGKYISASLGTSFISGYGDFMNIPTVGVRAGVVSFFNRYVGVRGFFGVDVGFWRYSGVLGMVSLGIDAIAEFPLSKKRLVFMGGLLGIGGDAYFYYDKRDYNSFDNMRKTGEVFMQAGITMMLGKRNRVQAIYRFLPARRAANFSPLGIVMLEYMFKF